MFALLLVASLVGTATALHSPAERGEALKLDDETLGAPHAAFIELRSAGGKEAPEALGNNKSSAATASSILEDNATLSEASFASLPVVPPQSGSPSSSGGNRSAAGDVAIAPTLPEEENSLAQAAENENMTSKPEHEAVSNASAAPGATLLLDRYMDHLNASGVSTVETSELQQLEEATARAMPQAAMRALSDVEKAAQQQNQKDEEEDVRRQMDLQKALDRAIKARKSFTLMVRAWIIHLGVLLVGMGVVVLTVLANAEVIANSLAYRSRGEAAVGSTALAVAASSTTPTNEANAAATR